MHYATKHTVSRRNTFCINIALIYKYALIYGDTTVGTETEDSCLELFKRYYKSMTS